MIGFLIRAGFWFSLVLLMLPLGAPAGGVGPIEALLAAREAVEDISGICERKPDVCETGRAALSTIGAKAKASARLAFEMLDEEGPVPAVRPDEEISTGTVQALPEGDSDRGNGRG
jgi:hypothetical protein